MMFKYDHNGLQVESPLHTLDLSYHPMSLIQHVCNHPICQKVTGDHTRFDRCRHLGEDLLCHRSSLAHHLCPCSARTCLGVSNCHTSHAESHSACGQRRGGLWLTHLSLTLQRRRRWLLGHLAWGQKGRGRIGTGGKSNTGGRFRRHGRRGRNWKVDRTRRHWAVKKGLQRHQGSTSSLMVWPFWMWTSVKYGNLQWEWPVIHQHLWRSQKAIDIK